MLEDLIPLLESKDKNSIQLAVDIALEHLDEVELRALRRRLHRNNKKLWMGYGGVKNKIKHYQFGIKL